MGGWCLLCNRGGPLTSSAQDPVYLRHASLLSIVAGSFYDETPMYAWRTGGPLPCDPGRVVYLVVVEDMGQWGRRQKQ